MSETIEILNKRLFAVDHETLFDAFANPEKLVHWWGPNGFTNRIDAFDLRPGGDWRITMTASNGTDFDNHSTFEVVEPPHRIAPQSWAFALTGIAGLLFIATGVLAFAGLLAVLK